MIEVDAVGGERHLVVRLVVQRVVKARAGLLPLRWRLDDDAAMTEDVDDGPHDGDERQKTDDDAGDLTATQ